MTTKGKTKLMLYLGKCANDGKPHHLRDVMVKLLLLTSKSDGVSMLQQSSAWYLSSKYLPSMSSLLLYTKKNLLVRDLLFFCFSDKRTQKGLGKKCQKQQQHYTVEFH